MLIVGVVPSVFLYPFKMEQRHREAVMSLSTAQSEAKEHGEQRRQRIRDSVRNAARLEQEGTKLEEKS